MEENKPTPSNQDKNSIIDILENRLYFTNTLISTRDVIEKISEFSNFLNSSGRITLLKADPQEAQELANLFLTLKSNIKSAISELGRSHYKKLHFLCPECNENIQIIQGDDILNHEHFEELFNDFLSGKLQVLPPQTDSSDETDAIPHTSDLNNINTNNDHTDSGIEQCEEQQENYSPNPEEEAPLGDNSFRFNFILKYDAVIENVIYPERFISMNKFDQCPYISIQKSSPFRAVCLLCYCDLLSTKRISKKQCLDHILGQRHMKSSVNPVNVENLKNYHEVFWNLNTCYQAHQVYFEPYSLSEVICKLCKNCVVPNKGVIDHIHSKFHNVTVIQFFTQKSSEYYLLDVQVGCYGIEVAKSIESPKKESKKEKMEPKKDVKKRSNTSTSKEEPEVEHNIIPSVVNSGKNIIEDFLPHRFHEHTKYFTNHSTFLSCKLCLININKDPKHLKKHIISQTHLQLHDIKVQKYTFFCEICNVRLADEITWDKHFIGGQNRHSKVSKSRANKLREYECTTCRTIIYGDEVSLSRHKNKSKRGRGQEPKLPEQVKNFFKSRETVENLAKSLTEEANNTVTCMDRTLQCCARLEAVLKSSLEDCKAYPFGSRMSGLGNRESDLDLFIDTGNMYFGTKKQDSVSQIQIVKLVSGILRKQKGEFEKILDVPTARTPIVKLKHIATNLECDLSFKHGLSVENTKFLRLCLDLQPICQQFILVLKKWSEHNKLTEYITTYALALLAIFYLQTNGYLLSVKKLRELNPSPAPVIDGWETIKYTVPLQSMKYYVIPYQHDLIRLLKDFFDYYKDFNYFKDTVCPLLGYTIERKLFEDPKCLPPEMESYVKQLKGTEPEQFRFMSPFCIQDPFDLSHNLTKACSSDKLSMFKKLCQLSVQHLETL